MPSIIIGDELIYACQTTGVCGCLRRGSPTTLEKPHHVRFFYIEKADVVRFF